MSFCVAMHKGFCILPPVSKTRGLVKTPGPFKCVFTRYRCFFPYGSSKRWLHTFTKEFTGARKGKGTRRGKGRGKGEGTGKKDRVSQAPFLITKSYRFRYRFVIVRESCVRSFFSGNGCNHQKKECSDYPGTFLVQNLTRILLARHYGEQTI